MMAFVDVLSESGIYISNEFGLRRGDLMAHLLVFGVRPLVVIAAKRALPCKAQLSMLENGDGFLYYYIFFASRHDCLRSQARRVAPRELNR
jgi:hypothetical protein